MDFSLLYIAHLMQALSAGGPPPAGPHPLVYAASFAADTPSLQALIARGLETNPEIAAASARVRAAQARVRPAGALPDPILGVGIQNLPLGREAMDPQSPDAGKPEMMTMKMLSIGQTLPYPGKLRLRREAAKHELDAATAELDAARQRVIQAVKDAYYELVFLDDAFELVRSSQAALTTVMKIAEGRYAVGATAQQDAISARVQAAQLSQDASALVEQRRIVLARLNAVLNRTSDVPVAKPAISATLIDAAVPSSTERIRFVSQTLGARAGNSPLPGLAELQTRAETSNPEIRAHEAMISAQSTRLELARKAALPDFDLSLQYGQRSQRPDMISAMVSVPLPIHRRAKQDQEITEAAAQLASLEAEHHTRTNEIHSRVAELSAGIEQDRTQLSLLKAAVLPQARAAVESASASYRVGKLEFASVLQNETTVFNAETAYYRLLSDFARKVAELERVVGGTVIQ